MDVQTDLPYFLTELLYESIEGELCGIFGDIQLYQIERLALGFEKRVVGGIVVGVAEHQDLGGHLEPDLEVVLEQRMDVLGQERPDDFEQDFEQKVQLFARGRTLEDLLEQAEQMVVGDVTDVDDLEIERVRPLGVVVLFRDQKQQSHHSRALLHILHSHILNQ